MFTLEPGTMSDEPLVNLLRAEGSDTEADEREEFALSETRQLDFINEREGGSLRTGKVGVTMSMLERSRSRHATPKPPETKITAKPFTPGRRVVKKGMSHEIQTLSRSN